LERDFPGISDVFKRLAGTMEKYSIAIWTTLLTAAWRYIPPEG
jgi:hypothetical protein